ncbi:MAG: ribosome biogenesis GTP-binding protein YihA/YsxC [Bacteroidota bacterium]|nr:ribosome biogenesis GTP-binding protein YihA/YsxC [Candidatus Kapabacteria bacterium]MDW8221076.1 ribosome biogenesis GTP-binding protein YihA/YsxC [Bacteroidota bacterium]
MALPGVVVEAHEVAGMRIYDAQFLIGAVKPEDFPEKTALPEVVFLGRSNVGKSSLINSIVRRKNLAHVSAAPGKTQQINFFGVNRQWILVDCPGFGYAKVSQQERRLWEQLIYQYLHERKQLRLVCYLIDSRHGPSPLDLAVLEELELMQRRYVVIITKKDKVSSATLAERITQIQELMGQCVGCVEILPYSSVLNDTRENLWAVLKRECSL